MFIVLSGYSLMLPISQKNLLSLPSNLDFFKRRARRILPPYYAAIVLALLLGAAFPDADAMLKHWNFYQVWPTRHEFIPSLLTHLFLVHNLFWRFTSQIDAALWSVATEWQIYFLFPLLLLPVRAKFGGIAAAAIGFAFGVLPITHHLITAQPQFAGAFAIGMLAADASFRDSIWRKKLLLVASISLVIAIIGGLVLRHHDVLNLVFSDIPWSVLQGCLLVYLSQANDSPLAKLFTLKPFKVLGEFSYSLYLVHFPLLVAFAMVLPQGPWYFALMCASVVPVLLLAYGFHLVFERPFMRWKNPA
jgi:peptidoglycan/LPS O-acetylase OafA/YrhL